MNIQQISTKKYFIRYIYSFLSFGFATTIVFFFSTYTGEARIDSYDLPKVLYPIASVTIALTYILSSYFFMTKSYKVGLWEFKNNMFLDGENNKYELQNINNIKLLMNPSDIKPLKNRTITRSGGNNWIEFEYDRKKIKFEFLLDGKESENELLALTEEWKKITKVSISKAPKAFFDYFEW